MILNARKSWSRMLTGFKTKNKGRKKMPDRIDVYVKNVLTGAVIEIERMAKWHIRENHFLNFLNLCIQFTKGS